MNHRTTDRGSFRGAVSAAQFVVYKLEIQRYYPNIELRGNPLVSKHRFNREWFDQLSEAEANCIVDGWRRLHRLNVNTGMLEEAAKAIYRFRAQDKENQKGEPMARDKKTDPFDNVDVSIKHQGREITLPEHPQPMGYDQAINMLRRKKEEEETEVNIHETVEAFPWDGAQAFMKAMRDIYGWTQAVPTPGFFGSNPPVFVTIKTGPGINDNAQIIWGSFKLPNVEGRLETSMFHNSDGQMRFAINGRCLRKHHREIKELADRTRQYVRDHSIYKGRAIRLHCDDDGDLLTNKEPEFFDTAKTNPEDLIFSRHVEEQVVTNVFTPIEQTQFCQRHNIPLSRGILCEGKFGTGKTLLSAVTARKCEENGWTYIVIDDAKALNTALEFAQLYSPAVVFAEDIDRVLSGERDREMDRILNTIDGVTGKSNQIMTILTTNEVEKIHPAMLRPGRLDAVISITPPDAEAAQRLMRSYGRHLIDANDPLEEAGQELEGAIPAVIREVVERAKLFALSRSHNGDIKLQDADLAASARGMMSHLALLNREREEPSVEHQAGAALKRLMNGHDQDEDQVLSRLDSGTQNLGRMMDHLRRQLNKLEQGDPQAQKLADQISKLQPTLKAMRDDLKVIRKEVE